MATVLIVEDDPDMRELESTVLASSGYQVMTAANGLDALTQLDERRPCVILLDLMMPVMDGLTFLRKRLDHPTGATIPVVCLSAASPAMIRDADRLGAAECVRKPVDLDQICALVARHCG